MQQSPGLRLCQGIALFALTFGILSSPGVARADLLVNDWNNVNGPIGVLPDDPGQLVPAVAYLPHGPAVRETTPDIDACGLLALLGVCIHPPIFAPTPVTPVISGSGGGGDVPPPVHIASSSPEPGSLLIGLTGVAVAGLARFVRRRRPTAMA